MTTGMPGTGGELLCRTLYDITQVLESADGADERVRKVLEHLGGLVPYEQCAMLEARLGYPPHVLAVPDPLPEERAVLTGTLVSLFRQLVDPNARASTPAARPRSLHLAVPLVGLDEVNGLLFVRSSVAEYTEEHLRALSVVAATLAAYFTMLRARTDLDELARQRNQARHAAEAARRAKDEFLALVSYELKTPLSSILASARVLRSTSVDAAARICAIDELERNVQVQSRLLDDILDLACLASDQLRLNLGIIEPAGLIKTTIEGLRLDAERKSIGLSTHLDPAAMPLVVDPERISQVVAILVANAINFTPAGGHIEVRLMPALGYARIQVSDSGRGISPEALPHVFDRFRQAPAAGTRAHGPIGDGLGIGLAIVRDLVELHGGRVRAQSAGPQRGATFTVELPLGPGRSPAPVSLPAGQRREGLLSGIRVLLLDHDPGLREAYQSVLDDYGAEVTAVASAPEALAALERSLPDVLLFGDLAIRGESAYGLMREVTARAFPLPIASISASKREKAERELATGLRLHLTKPVAIGTLIDAVADLAGRTREKAPRPFAEPARPVAEDAPGLKTPAGPP